ncbi:unnamed protein product, partial [Cyprideis torosa]
MNNYSIQSKINVNSAAYKENYEANMALVEELQKFYKDAQFQGNEKHINRAKQSVKMATNEETDDESLGGAKMHSTISGCSDFFANDEKQALSIARGIVKTFKPDQVKAPRSDFRPPRYSGDEILGLVSSN